MKEYTLTPEIILHAYKIGIFPMADTRDSKHYNWVMPDKRAILPLGGLRQIKSLNKLQRHNNWHIKINSNFPFVINMCASTRKETWINAEIEHVFTLLNKLGYAHSVETWNEDKIVGGLYGLSLNGAFFGESMFSIESGASKIALLWLHNRLLTKGFKLLDCQIISDHLVSIGSIEISNHEYLKKLTSALKVNTNFIQ